MKNFTHTQIFFFKDLQKITIKSFIIFIIIIFLYKIIILCQILIFIIFLFFYVTKILTIQKPFQIEKSLFFKIFILIPQIYAQFAAQNLSIKNFKSLLQMKLFSIRTLFNFLFIFS